jgi:hypothetical protein
MTINSKYYVQKKEFVAKLSEVLNLAKPHLTCEYKLGEELPTTKRWMNIKNEDGSISYQEVDYQPQGEFVIVTCENGYQYELNVSGNSLAAIGEEVFTKMVCK